MKNHRSFFRIAAALAAAWVIPAAAADRVLVLDDAAQQALIQVLDVATKAQGLNIARTTLGLLDALQRAPVLGAKQEEPKGPDRPAAPDSRGDDGP